MSEPKIDHNQIYPHGYRTDPSICYKKEGESIFEQLDHELDPWLAIKKLASSISHQAVPPACPQVDKWLAEHVADPKSRSILTSLLGQLHTDYVHAMVTSLERAIRAELLIEVEQEEKRVKEASEAISKADIVEVKDTVDVEG